MSHHHAPHDRRFPFEKAERLDDEARRARQPAEPALDALALEPDSVVIDLGAGTGYFTMPLAARLERLGGSGRVVALDIEPRMLERLVERAAATGLAARVAALRIDEAASDRLPLPPASADRALLVNLYHELPDRPGSLAELRRVLRPGGGLLLVDWDPAGTGEVGPPLEHRIPPAQAEVELRQAGFGRIEALSLYRPHFYAFRAISPA